MRIGQLAARTGVSVRALRYYEEHHLLTAERTPSGQRVYGEAAVRRVEMIQRLYGAGLSSKSIRYIMPCMASGDSSPELVDYLVAERDRIDRQIVELQQTRDELTVFITNAAESAVTGISCAPQ
ncbi:MerR family transcriptional regulator [Nocardia brasiliensis]|uniref:MerR family transcriptional regulator n=1 Tax=Nocardia brasiliensis TaxID=37326 RepID=A0A6G9XZ73_NOCBR|nr:MerR family transcriptional regulator [Nocardia brasiliensis]QIS06221.1 MerR family transcriptional regulator [Nocardia brasiliensis]